MATYLLQKSLSDLPVSLTWYTVSLWGKLLRSIYLAVICSYKRDQSSACKTREGEQEERSSLSVCPTQVENLVTPGPKSHGAGFAGLRTALGKALSFCKGIIVPCLLTECDFFKPRLCQGPCQKWNTVLRRLGYSVVVQTSEEALVLVKLCWKEFSCLHVTRRF